MNCACGWCRLFAHSVCILLAPDSQKQLCKSAHGVNAQKIKMQFALQNSRHACWFCARVALDVVAYRVRQCDIAYFTTAIQRMKHTL